MIRVENILCLTDFSEDSSNALNYAHTLAELFSTRLIVMHVISNPTSPIYGEIRGDYLMMEKNAREKAQQNMEKYDEVLRDYPNHELVTRLGEIVPSVLDTVKNKNVGTVVLGSHGQGHHALRHILLGSTTAKVLQSVSCPVMVVRHPERPKAA
jgi:nucleotide-binding universal stress UspA family protein